MSRWLLCCEGWSYRLDLHDLNLCSNSVYKLNLAADLFMDLKAYNAVSAVCVCSLEMALLYAKGKVSFQGAHPCPDKILLHSLCRNTLILVATTNFYSE